MYLCSNQRARLINLAAVRHLRSQSTKAGNRKGDDQTVDAQADQNFCCWPKAGFHEMWLKYEPCYEKTGLRDFRPGPTQTGLYSHRGWLEA